MDTSLKKLNYMTFFVYNSFYNERYIITFIIINDAAFVTCNVFELVFCLNVCIVYKN